MITRLYIESFGKIKDMEITLSSRLNVIYGKNESGKSTICAFIRAMLYGVDTERRRGVRGNMRKRYTPLDGSIMSGVLETENYIITRTFGASAKFDTCRAVNRHTGEVIDADKIGYTVMGMNEACFCSTFYMNSFDSYPSAEEELLEKLSGASGENGEVVSYDRVCAELDNMARPYVKRSGLVDRALEKSREAQEYYENEKKKRERYDALKESYDVLVQKRAAAQAELEKLEAAREKLAQQTVELRSRQRQLFDEIAFESSVPKRKIKTVPAVMAAVFAVIGAMFVFAYKNPMFLLCMSAFIPMIICLKMSGVFNLGRTEQRRITADMQLAAIEKIMEKTGGAENADIDSKVKKINEFLLECAARIAQAEYELKNTELDDAAQKRAEDAKAEYERLSEERDCINVAKMIISQCYDELKGDFMPEINRAFSDYFSRLTGGRYSGAAADREMKFSVIDASGAAPWEYLSGGTLDGAYFALRLALCDKADTEDRGIMVIDDAFLQYDDERVKNSVQILSEMSRQTVYFTCRENFGNVRCKLIKI